MLASLLSVVALASAASVASALPTHPFTNIVVRADSATNTTLPGGAVIPAACDSTCSATLVTYGYCLEADNRCLDICTDANYDAFVSCANCAFMYSTFSASQYVQLQATASTLVQTCAAAKKPVSPSKTFTPYAQLSSMWQQSSFSTSAGAAASTAGAASPSQSASAAAAAAAASPTSAGSRTTALSAGLVGAIVLVGAVLA